MPADVLAEISRQWGPEQEEKWLKEEKEYIESLPKEFVRGVIGTPGTGCKKFKFDWQLVQCMLRACVDFVHAEPDANGDQKAKTDILDKIVLGSRRKAAGGTSMLYPCLMDRFPDLDFEHPFRRLASDKGQRVWIRVGSKPQFSKSELTLR